MSRFTGVAWLAYEAAHHCESHAIARFGFDALNDGSARDAEGNPIGACAPWDECSDDAYCDECLYAEISARDA
jgi:hypothetical protein